MTDYGPADSVLHADNYGHGPAGIPCATCAGHASLAAEARHGGRVISRQLAEKVPDFWAHYVTLPTGKGLGEHVEGETPIWIAALRGDLGPDKLRDCWAMMIDPYTGTGFRRDAWQSYARSEARGHNDSARRVTLTEAEAMLDWPIYRAVSALRTVARTWPGAHHG